MEEQEGRRFELWTVGRLRFAAEFLGGFGGISIDKILERSFSLKESFFVREKRTREGLKRKRRKGQGRERGRRKGKAGRVFSQGDVASLSERSSTEVEMKIFSSRGKGRVGCCRWTWRPFRGEDSGFEARGTSTRPSDLDASSFRTRQGQRIVKWSLKSRERKRT